jgi:hypothetical protein
MHDVQTKIITAAALVAYIGPCHQADLDLGPPLCVSPQLAALVSVVNIMDTALLLAHG